MKWDEAQGNWKVIRGRLERPRLEPAQEDCRHPMGEAELLVHDAEEIKEAFAVTVPSHDRERRIPEARTP